VSTSVLQPGDGRFEVIETETGDCAASILIDRAGLKRGPRGQAFLRRLARSFSRIPYENISKIIKVSLWEDPRLALRLPAEVVSDHFERGFGGTCFSLTFLLERVLRSFGFDACKVMARMNSGDNVHCLVVVREPEATYMMDPGYALHEVVTLPASRAEVDFAHAAVEVIRSRDGRFDLWTRDPSGRKWRYAFQDRAVPDAEFERYWVESFTKPTLNSICLTRMTPRGHIYLRNDFFKFTSREGIEKRSLGRDIEKIVESEFGIPGDFTAEARRIIKQKRSREQWRK
jgi:arylamine N-acetyltransferase